MKLCTVFLIFVILCLPSGAKASIDVCHFAIGVAANGALYDLNAANMPALRRSLPTLEKNLHGGCYNDSNASPVTSVTLYVAAGASGASVDAAYAVLARDGWPKERVVRVGWKNAPQRPSIPSRH